mmetsp:Transcript_53735/g.114143  ORF Transcript_53735/g.114143 Transcript_53735/m.114143 type:complete len:400 (-) Transcript_53735:26-1225(-)
MCETWDAVVVDMSKDHDGSHFGNARKSNQRRLHKGSLPGNVQGALAAGAKHQAEHQKSRSSHRHLHRDLLVHFHAGHGHHHQGEYDGKYQIVRVLVAAGEYWGGRGHGAREDARVRPEGAVDVQADEPGVYPEAGLSHEDSAERVYLELPVLHQILRRRPPQEAAAATRRGCARAGRARRAREAADADGTGTRRLRERRQLAGRPRMDHPPRGGIAAVGAARGIVGARREGGGGDPVIERHRRRRRQEVARLRLIRRDDGRVNQPLLLLISRIPLDPVHPIVQHRLGPRHRLQEKVLRHVREDAHGDYHDRGEDQPALRERPRHGQEARAQDVVDREAESDEGRESLRLGGLSRFSPVGGGGDGRRGRDRRIVGGIRLALGVQHRMLSTIPYFSALPRL